jgi:hypothetical protein
MAGMRPFGLSQKFGAAYYDSLAAGGCSSSQIRDRQAVSCSPLEGDCRPRADKLKPGPRGSGFLFVDWRSRCPIPARHLEWASSTSLERVVERLRGGGCRFRLALLWHYAALARLGLNNISGKTTNGLDHSDARRDLPRAGNQRVPAGRILIARVSHPH